MRPLHPRLMLLLSAVFILSAHSIYAVPVMPNAGLVRAEVLQVERSGEAGVPQVLKVRIISSKEAGELPNFTRDKVGRSLDLHTKEDVSTLKKGDTVSARVQYVGDERGGLFWATDISRLAK